MDAKDTEEYDELEYDESEDDEFDLGKYHNAPTANLYSTRDLHGMYHTRITGCVLIATEEMIHEGEIELDPPYQRGKPESHGCHPSLILYPRQMSFGQTISK